MDWSLLFSSYGSVFTNLQVIMMTFLGALGGVLLGAIPGMTATMGVALLIPFSFGMDLIPSVGLLLGIYCGGMYGGSISAILIHAPGTPSAAATLLDGYPMCPEGPGGQGAFHRHVLLLLRRRYRRAGHDLPLPDRREGRHEVHFRRNADAGGVRPVRHRRHLRQVHRQGHDQRVLRHGALHRRPRPDVQRQALHLRRETAAERFPSSSRR